MGQAKLAGAAGADVAKDVTHAFAMFVLSLLGPKSWAELRIALGSNIDSSAATDARKRWGPLLGEVGEAWRSLPTERSTVFRTIMLEGSDLSGYKAQLELVAPMQLMTWDGLSYGTLDRRVATYKLRDSVGIVYKIHALSARKLHEFSWVAGEEANSTLQEALLAPRTQFQARGFFELNDLSLRHDVPLDAKLAGPFALASEFQSTPLTLEEALKKRRVLVVLD